MADEVEKAVKDSNDDQVQYPAVPDWQQLIYAELVLIRELQEKMLKTLEYIEQSKKK